MAYTGIGDLGGTIGTGAQEFWGVRAWSQAAIGGIQPIQISDNTGANLLSLPFLSNGSVDASGVPAWSASFGTPFINRMRAQVSQNTANALSNSGGEGRPNLIQSQLGFAPVYSQVLRANSQGMNATAQPSISPPYTFYVYANLTTNHADFGDVLFGASTSSMIGGANAANTYRFLVDGLHNVNATATDGVWHSFIGTIDASNNQVFYIDGVSAGTGTNTGVSITNAGWQWFSAIGFSTSNSTECALWTVALNATQVAAVHQNAFNYYNGISPTAAVGGGGWAECEY